MLYPVTCECGRIFRVPSSDAGRVLSCDCGKTVEVPKLSDLRNQTTDEAVGQEAVLSERERPFDQIAYLLIAFAIALHIFVGVTRTEADIYPIRVLGIVLKPADSL